MFSRGLGDHMATLGFTLQMTNKLQSKQGTETEESLVHWVRGKSFKIHTKKLKLVLSQLQKLRTRSGI